MTSKEVIAALISRYTAYGKSERYIHFPELRIGTGYAKGSRSDRESTEQRIDLFVMSVFPSDHYEKTAFEVKVDRKDFLRELKKPLKRRQALLLCNSFYFATPKDLCNPEEIPIECGLMEVEEKVVGMRKYLVANVKVKAPWRDDVNSLSWGFVASLGRRIAREEKLQYAGQIPLCPNCYQPFKKGEHCWICEGCEISVGK